MHSNITEQKLKTIALYAGLAALVAGIGMAFEYGRAMSYLHAVSLSLLAIAGSLGFTGADILRSKGRDIAARLVVVATVSLLIGEYGTHFGYTVGHRVRDTQETGVQNARYDQAQKTLKSEAENLVIWRKSADDLKAERKSLLEAAPWAATVKPDGLRAELATLKERMAAEEKGQRGRRAGRGSEFERLQNQANDLEKRISSAERFSEVGKQISDLEKRIEATQRVIDKKTEVAGTTEFRSSKIVNQTAAFAQLVTWDDHPSEAAQSWVQLLLGAIIAAITTFLAPFFFSIAFADIVRKVIPASPVHIEPHQTPQRPALPAFDPAQVGALAPQPMAPLSAARSPLAQMPAAITTSTQADVYVVRDEEAQRLKQKIRDALAGFGARPAGAIA